MKKLRFKLMKKCPHPSRFIAGPKLPKLIPSIIEVERTEEAWDKGWFLGEPLVVPTIKSVRTLIRKHNRNPDDYPLLEAARFCFHQGMFV